jgi:hypothetical protein
VSEQGFVEEQHEQRKENYSMKLEINVPVSGLDLASLLEGEQGVFLCQNRGQTTSPSQRPVTRSPSGRRPSERRSRSRQ